MKKSRSFIAWMLVLVMITTMIGATPVSAAEAEQTEEAVTEATTTEEVTTEKATEVTTEKATEAATETTIKREEVNTDNLKAVPTKSSSDAKKAMETTAAPGQGDEFWNKCSSTYFYNKLNSEEKAMYNEFCACLDGALASSQYVSGKVTFPERLDKSKKAMVQKVTDYILYDRPQYFFWEGDLGYYYRGGKLSAIEFDFGKYSSGSLRYSTAQKIKKIVNTVITNINREHTLLNKEIAAHDWVVYNTRYPANSQVKYISDSQNIVSVFLNHKSVCTGYAKAFQLLSNAVGVETTFVVSNTHAWNKAKINNRWYDVDTTWDDPLKRDGKTEAGETKKFLNISDSTLAGYDRKEGSKAHTADRSISYPKASSGNLSSKDVHICVEDRGKIATCSASGKTSGKHCLICGKVVKKQVVIPKVSNIKLTTTKYKYTGSAKTPAVVVKDSSNKTLKKGTHYTVSYPASRTKVGKYKVTVTLKGNYKGTAVRYYNITK